MSTVANSRPRTMAAFEEEARFNREVAMLIGIVEPDRAVPTPAGPPPVTRSPGWLARLARSRSGSVALGFGIAAAIGGVVAIGVQSLPEPVAVEPASVTLAVPAADRPAPAVAAVTPAPVARQDDAPTKSTVSQPERARKRSSVRPAQLAMARSRGYAVRRAPTPQPTASETVTDDRRQPVRPVMVAAVDRSGPRAATDATEIAAAAVSSRETPSDRREAPAVRAERRDNVDALRQLRHQW